MQQEVRFFENGWLTVVTGSMFSGKTTKLIQTARNARKQNIQYCIFKPSLDSRYKSIEITSHDKDAEPCQMIYFGRPLDMMYEVNRRQAKVVIIDEAQFFTDALIDTVRDLLQNGRDVVIGGLKADFRNVPFGPMPQLLAIADDIIMLHATCHLTGLPATRTQRIVNGKPASFDDKVVLVGATEAYEARNVTTHDVPGTPWKLGTS